MVPLFLLLINSLVHKFAWKQLHEELMAGEEVATCPSCSLVVKVVYDLDKFKAEAEEVHKEDGDKETVKA